MANPHFTLKRKAVAAVLISEFLVGDQVKRGKTRDWVKRRNEKGLFSNLVKELSIEDRSAFKEMMRMNYEDFLQVLGYIERDITPKPINGGHEVIPPKARLAVTLRFLATGETFRSLSFQFRISKAAISYIVMEVCTAIFKNMAGQFLRTPETADEWKEIGRKFEIRWQFPHCIGAIDGKHLVIQPPPGAGSKFYNYKKTHSVVLMAVVGPDYECIYADVGTNGRVSDGGVWSKTSLARAIQDNEMSLPESEALEYGVKKVPYVFVADDAFSLKPYLMKPYPQSGLNEEKRIYNYRLSRARRISENFFGIIANRWRVFRSIILLPPEKVQAITLATITLHNYLRKSSSRHVYMPSNLTDTEYTHKDIIPGLWRRNPPSESLLPLQIQATGHNACTNAKDIRETFKNYFYNKGAVEWQWERC